MLVPARAAPRGPEVQDDRLAAELREVDRLARADGLQRETWCGAADERRVDVLRVFAQPEEEDADDGGDDQESDRENGAIHDAMSPRA